MTLTLNLSQDLEQRLNEESRHRGIPPEQCIVELLQKHIPLTEEEQRIRDERKRKELIALVQSWIDDGDADEQRETLEALVRGLNESRAGGRLLFPEELKGISW